MTDKVSETVVRTAIESFIKGCSISGFWASVMVGSLYVGGYYKLFKGFPSFLYPSTFYWFSAGTFALAGLVTLIHHGLKTGHAMGKLSSVGIGCMYIGFVAGAHVPTVIAFIGSRLLT